MKKCLELVSQNKHLLKEDINFEELIMKMNKLKAGSASLLVSDGMKVGDALKEVNISNGMVKKVSDKSVYHTAKLTKPKSRSHPNKGMKLVRNGNESTYISKTEYDELISSGKLKGKNINKDKKKNKIKGGAVIMNNTSNDDIVRRSLNM